MVDYPGLLENSLLEMISPQKNLGMETQGCWERNRGKKTAVKGD